MTAIPSSKRSRVQGGGLKNLGRAIAYLNHYRKTAVIAIVALVISLGAQLMVPQMIQNILDAIVGGMAAQQVAMLPPENQAEAMINAGIDPAQFDRLLNSAELAILWAVVLILLFAVARGAFAFTQTFLAQKLSQDVAFDFRNELFSKIQRLSFSYHDRNRTGQLMIRATDDVDKLQVFIGQGMLIALQAVLLLTGALILLLMTNFKLTLVILPILPIALILFMVFGMVSQPLFVKVQTKLSALNTILQENLAGIKVVKAFAREAEEESKFDASAEDYMKQQITVARVFSFLFPVIFLIANLGQALVLYFGGRQILAGTLTIGEWQKFSLYLALVFFPIGQLGFIISQMSAASASANRIFEILDASNDVTDKPDAVPLPPISGNVEFDNVSFRYFNSSDPVLSNINITARTGETVALLGSTGSGKTTIINLIPRFYDVSEGQLIIDGYDVRNVTIESLRRQIGIVLQETNLFTGTIRENIAYGRPDASDEDVIGAAKAAAAHDFIVGLPGGLRNAGGRAGHDPERRPETAYRHRACAAAQSARS